MSVSKKNRLDVPLEARESLICIKNETVSNKISQACKAYANEIMKNHIL